MLLSGSEWGARNSSFPNRVYFSLAMLPLQIVLSLFFLPTTELIRADGTHGLAQGMTLLVYCFGVQLSPLPLTQCSCLISQH